MAMARALFVCSALLLAGSNLVSGSPDTVFRSAQQRWPDAKSVMLVCNMKTQESTLRNLAAAAKQAGLSLEVFDVESTKDLDNAMGYITKSRPGFVILVDEDPVLGANNKLTQTFISRANRAGVPTVSTGKELLKIGATLSLETDSKG